MEQAFAFLLLVWCLIVTLGVPGLCVIFIISFCMPRDIRRCLGTRGDTSKCDRLGRFRGDRSFLCRTCNAMKVEYVRAYKRAQHDGGLRNMRLELELRQETVKRYFDGIIDCGHLHQVELLERLIGNMSAARSRPPPVWEDLPW